MTDHLSPPDSGNGPEPWDAIARFLAGESTPSEAVEVRRWLAEHPDDANVVAALDALLPVGEVESFRINSAATSFAGPLDVEGALDRVRARMETAPVGQMLKRPAAPKSFAKVASARRPRSLWQIGGMAAAAAALAAMGVSSYRASDTPTPTVAVTYDTKVGTGESITLPDSSKVVLAPGSRLVVAANYGNGQRNVELQGAGQFTVRHDASRPFTVRAGSAIITDLGTVFAVKSVQGAGISVAVTEGSVALSDSSPAHKAQAIELKAGDRGRLQADGSVTSERGKVTPDELSWVTGTLVYRDAPLAEVQADLLRWYGVQLIVRDSAMAAQSVRTQGLASEPVGKILDRMAALMGGVVSQRGDTVFIDKAGDRSKH